MIKINGILEATTDQELTAVKNDLADYFGYEEEDAEGVPNPETKAEFVIRMATQYLVDCVNSHRLRVATEEAKNNVVRVEIDESIVPIVPE